MAKKQPVDIKKFRHAVSVLAKAGIIGKTDARRAQPYWIRRTGPRGQHESLLKIVEQHDDLLSGKVSTVVLETENTKKFKRQGFESIKLPGKKERLLIPHAADEKVTVRGGTFVYVNPSGIESVAVPCEYHDLEQWLLCIKKNKRQINAMKRRDEWFGIRYWGNQTKKYRTIEDLIEDFRKYDDIIKAIKSGRPKDMGEQFAHMEIVKIGRSAPTWHGPQGRTRSHGTKEAQKRASERYRDRVAANPMKAAAQRSKHAEDERNRRAQMSQTEKVRYAKKAKARAKKSRAKKKG